MCRLFAFEELKQATNGFDSSRFLGEGSTGKVSSKTGIGRGKNRLNGFLEMAILLVNLNKQRNFICKEKGMSYKYLKAANLFFSLPGIRYLLLMSFFFMICKLLKWVFSMLQIQLTN